MSIRLAIVLAVMVGCVTPAAADAERNMYVYGVAPAPFGYVDFCHRHPLDCGVVVSASAGSGAVIRAGDHWEELDEVNRAANNLVTPLSDLVQYSKEEYWTYPDSGKGDCEDYVLLKMRELRARQWPASALLITVVLDENNEGHAVLAVRTDLGDLILDNKTNQILLWNETPYTFIKRQSPTHPLEWEQIIRPPLS